jgi:hypothetical protein
MFLVDKMITTGKKVLPDPVLFTFGTRNLAPSTRHFLFPSKLGASMLTGITEQRRDDYHK